MVLHLFADLADLSDVGSWKILDPTLWERYGLAGMFGLALVVLLAYVIGRLIPRLFSVFSAELAEERQFANAQMAAERAHCSDNHQEQVKLILEIQQDNRREHEETRRHAADCLTELARHFDRPPQDNHASPAR